MYYGMKVHSNAYINNYIMSKVTLQYRDYNNFIEQRFRYRTSTNSIMYKYRCANITKAQNRLLIWRSTEPVPH